METTVEEDEVTETSTQAQRARCVLLRGSMLLQLHTGNRSAVRAIQQHSPGLSDLAPTIAGAIWSCKRPRLASSSGATRNFSGV